ncbi:MAG: lipid-A-disaccharide synthase [Phycisphaerales bacterium]|nr:lipid-A-disaccharide synthase [Phycisphaerales bacterium]
MSNRQEPSSPPRFFISAAEPSGDLHGASLIRAMRDRCPGAEWAGIAGPDMQAEGCRAIADLTGHAGMLLGTLGPARRGLVALKRAVQEFRERQYDAVVVIDSPVLNLRLARRAHAFGIPVLYYIAPQLWAWGKWRVGKLRRYVRKLAVVLPFEERFFRDLGLDATFVGHPLFDVLPARAMDADCVDRIRAAGRPVVAILPGSRRHVVDEVLPGQLAVARAIRDKFPGAHIGVSLANDAVAQLVDRHVAAAGVAVERYRQPNAELLSAADLTLVASGTATLEVAHYACPMIVMYNGSRLMYHLLGRWLVRLDRYSLVNILAGRELVPEFMPYYTSTQPIADAAIGLLENPAALDAMRRDLHALIDPVRTRGAAARTADMLLEIAR